MWISAALALVCVGLLVWALSINSDLDETEQQVADLQTQVEQAQDTGGSLQTALQGAYEQLTQAVGAAQANVDSTRQSIEQAKANVQQAQQDAQAAASQAADTAASAADQARARIDEAQANTEVAKGQAQIAADCGKAYLGALGALFEGDSVTSQLETVRTQLQGITADCRTALSGS